MHQDLKNGTSECKVINTIRINNKVVGYRLRGAFDFVELDVPIGELYQYRGLLINGIVDRRGYFRKKKQTG